MKWNQQIQKYILSFCLLICNNNLSFGQESLKSIQSILKNDFLTEVAKKEEEEKQKELSEKKIEEDITGHFYPKTSDIWSLLTQVWFIKNSVLLHWDFKNPDLGILQGFIDLLQKVGLIGKKIHLLILDTTRYPHGALPMKENEFLFFISLPFIRSLDLSTLEISLLMLEDYFRVNLGVFKNYVKDDSWYNKLGTNFYGKSPDVSFITQSIEKYTQFFTLRGYTPNEEKMVFTSMKTILSIDDAKLYLGYQEMLKKINDLITINDEYSYYSKLYPSPYLKLGQWNSKD